MPWTSKTTTAPNDRSDQSRGLVGAIPAQSLAEEGGDKCPDDAENRREDEARGARYLLV